MRRRRSFRSCLGVAAVASAAACAGSPTFDGSVYRGQGVAFRLSPLPASWHQVSLPAADLAFRDEAHDASVLINSRCASSDRDAPLVSLTEHLIIGTTDRRIAHEDNIPFDGREARHTELRARLDGVPMEYDIFVLKKDSCVFDLVYVTTPDAATSRAGAAEFETFVQGFHTIAGPG
jgi:hypothetical protein